VSRWLLRVAAWATGWTLFLWWAVIGWPASAETAQATLSVLSGVSIAGLVGWYGWQNLSALWARFSAAVRGGRRPE
jgi:hypothetical protein